jgi:AraC-like DNA-binding protein
MIEPFPLEAVVRGVAIGAFAATGVALAASRKLAPTRWIGALFFVCAIAHVIDSSFGPLHPSKLVCGLSVSGSGLFWLFALGLFEDEPVLKPWRLIPPLGMFGLGIVAVLSPPTVCIWVWKIFAVASTALVLHVLTVAWRGWRDDLVDQRRRLRAPLAAATAGYVLVQAACDFGWPVFVRALDAPLVQAFSLAGLGIAASLALLRVEPLLVAVAAVPGQIQTPASAEGLSLGPADRLVMARLERAMTQDEVWRDEDLSIGTLAALVGAPEHRLRKLINGTLGHRNFADYVNSRRIAAAKIALSDPELALKSVSAIAYDLGFGSLGPFNRAFRAETGSTPTAWRQNAGADAPTPRLRLVESGDRASKSNMPV